MVISSTDDMACPYSLQFANFKSYVDVSTFNTNNNPLLPSSSSILMTFLQYFYYKLFLNNNNIHKYQEN